MNTNLQIRHKFKEIVQRNFLAEVQSTNFALAEDSANEINEWVSSATRKRITQIVTAGEFLIFYINFEVINKPGRNFKVF